MNDVLYRSQDRKCLQIRVKSTTKPNTIIRMKNTEKISLQKIGDKQSKALIFFCKTCAYTLNKVKRSFTTIIAV